MGGERGRREKGMVCVYVGGWEGGERVRENIT